MKKLKLSFQYCMDTDVFSSFKYSSIYYQYQYQYKYKRKYVHLLSKVDECVGENSITDMWKTHFSTLLKSVSDNTNKTYVEHLPDAFMKFAIVPIIKNKAGDPSNINSYRPIALVTAVTKIFELCIINMLFDTCDNQLGFKKQHSTDMCIYASKTVINYYYNFNSPVY